MENITLPQMLILGLEMGNLILLLLLLNLRKQELTELKNQNDELFLQVQGFNAKESE